MKQLLKKLKAKLFNSYAPKPIEAEFEAMKSYGFKSKADFLKVRNAVYHVIASLDGKAFSNGEYAAVFLINTIMDGLIQNNPEMTLQKALDAYSHLKTESTLQISQVIATHCEQLTGYDYKTYVRIEKEMQKFNRLEMDDDETIN